MSTPPDRIETLVTRDAWVKPIGITLQVHVVGTASVGSMAAVRKSKELVAIQDLMRGLGVGDDKIRIDSLTFAAGERWFSGSSVEIDLEIRDVPAQSVPEALGGLASLKGVSLRGMRREYGALSAERDELLRAAVAESMRQARLIADAAGLRLRSVHSLSQQWGEPNDDNDHAYPMARGARAKLAMSADDMKGYQLVENHEGKLSLTVRMELRVGEFGEGIGGTESGGG
ncbi:SIMPL domain-containing protein [Lysobacter yananisis]|uniref:SIMPL domain-containing protein n=1 Tax=Lysobacter yananisis TaxID=1003114 RepID=A0ABY9PDY7_9GAMM|nr:SIMPL domain-containing protein [Lysobacter yananisis]WMT05283.1 SIMPL domain-containing protein [Lysobacter yananisis]